MDVVTGLFLILDGDKIMLQVLFKFQNILCQKDFKTCFIIHVIYIRNK